ncbi:MAG: hypothetical protein WCI09_05845 [Planctomycetota bacterium]
MQTQLRIVLREVESLNSEQVQILAIASGFVSGGQFGGQAKVSMPKLKTLDSALLAQTLLQCSSDCGGVVTISPEAATALAGVPNREAINPSGTVRVLPPYGLSFPCLQELNPATARLLMTHSWSGISLPALRDVSLETVHSLVRQTCNLSLDMTTLPPERASAFGAMASDTGQLRGGTLVFPY